MFKILLNFGQDSRIFERLSLQLDLSLFHIREDLFDYHNATKKRRFLINPPPTNQFLFSMGRERVHL